VGIQLPAELADLAAVTGVRWPQADETAMAASAMAWRAAATDLTALGTDADSAAHAAFRAFEGGAAGAARRHWDGYVSPDGRLPAAVRACNEAAERLDHGAEQIGAAKTEIIRQLVALKQQQAAAQQAHAAGHPNALAGIPTLIAGTSTTLARVHGQLTEAVWMGSGTVLGEHPLPGQGVPPGHQPDTQEPRPDLFRADRDAAVKPIHDGPDALDDVAGVVDVNAGEVAGREPSGQNPVPFPPPTDPDSTGPIPIVGRTASTAAPDYTGYADGRDFGPAGSSGYQPSGGPVSDPAPAIGSGPVSSPGSVSGPGLVAGSGSVSGSGSVGVPGSVPAGVVGPVPDTVDPVPDTVDPVTGSAQGGPATVRQAMAAQVELPASGAPVPVRPPDPGGFSPPPAAGGGAVAGGDPILGGSGGAAPVGRPPVGPIGVPVGPGAPSSGGAVAGPAPGGSASPSAPGSPGGQPSRVGAGPTAVAVGPRPPGAGGPVLGGPGQAAGPPAPGHGQQLAIAPADFDGDHQRSRGGYSPGMLVDLPDHAQPSRLPQAGQAGPEDPLELFMLFLFQPGQERAPAETPARQVPPPRQEFDLAAGLRFPPGAHPRAGLVSSADALAAVLAGREPVWLPAGLPDDSAPVRALSAGHDPLGGQHERDWARRFLVREAMAGPAAEYPLQAEYAWPPAEAFPEGACAPGIAEAVVLDPGTMIDRFGDPTGVVLAAAGTPFAQRSLPPEYRLRGYHRYEVRQPLPVWRAVSAAWFGQPGGGVRFRTTYPVLDLIALGYLVDVTYPGSAH
jgi:Tuberculosis necrotizing toxin